MAFLKCILNYCLTSSSKSEKTDNNNKESNKIQKSSKYRCRLAKNGNVVKNCSVELFYKHGLLVARHPYLFMIIPFVISAGLCLGMLTMKMEYSMPKLFAPSSSESNHEFNVFLDFFDDEGGLFYFVFFVRANNNGSLLTLQNRNDCLGLYRYFQYNYSVTVDGKNYTFNDLQINHKDENTLLLLLFEYYNTTSFPIQYTYPLLKISGETYNLNRIRNVYVDNNSMIMNFTSAAFMFNSAKSDAKHSQLLDAWAASFFDIKRTDNFQNIYFYFWNEELNTRDMVRNAKVAAPFVILGFSLMVIFACLVSLSKDPTKSKPWESITSIICVLLASGSSFGIVFLIGFPFVATVIVCPVLVLALGMDVTYIMLRSWRNTDPSLSPEIRLAETLAESGPSIVITTLTNVLSAGIGCITNILGMYVFSLVICISVSLLFVLQLTFFTAAVSLGGRREAAKKNGILVCLTVQKTTESVTDSSVFSKHIRLSDWWCICSKYLSEVLCTNLCRGCVCVFLIIYWATSIYGCIGVKMGLTPEKFLLTDSQLLKVMRFDEETINEHIEFPLYVFVYNPPNFTDINQISKFRHMVHEFEILPGCLGSEYTELWLRSMESGYSSFFDDDKESEQLDFYTRTDNFLQLSSSKRWLNYVVFEKTNTTFKIIKFMFIVMYKYTRNWDVRSNYTAMWRNVADRYKEFGVSSWGEDNKNFVSDQLDGLRGNAFQDFIITAVCMFFICILYIPNIFSTVCSILTVFSICVGTFGYLALWDVALDPISLTSFLLSIGYSVDFTSHISYHYYNSEGETQQLKLFSALSSIGLPMIETGCSTVLSVGCLCFVPCYVEWVFFKNILLIVIIGLLHGLVILPMFLAWIPLNCLQTLFMKKRDDGATTVEFKTNGGV